MTHRGLVVLGLTSTIALTACGDDTASAGDGDTETDGSTSDATITTSNSGSSTTGSDSSATDPDSSGTDDPPSDECDPDASLIDQGRACLEDDDCPCGAHCDLGECVAACSDDGDCDDDQRCDDFGRCRGAGTSDMLPPPPVEERPAVRPTSSSIIAAPGAEVELGLRVVGPSGDGEPIRARLVARDGAAVDCGDGFVAECTIEVDPDDPPTVDVRGSDEPRRSDPDLPPTSGSIDIHGEGKFFENVQLTSPEGDDGTPATSVAPGVYEGVASLEASGIGVEGAPLLPRANQTQLPVEVRVFNGGVIEVRDQLGALAPGGSLVGLIDGSDLAFPDILITSGEAMPGEVFEVIGSVTSSDVVIANDSIGLGFALDVRYEGLLLDGRAPTVRWRIAAAESDEPLGAPPAVPEDAVATIDPDALAPTPLGWDAAVRQALDAEDCSLFFCTVDPSPFIEAASGIDGGDIRLDVCGMTDAEFDDHAQQAATQDPGVGGLQGLLATELTSVGSNPTMTEALAQGVFDNAPGGAGADVHISRVLLSGYDYAAIPCDMELESSLYASTSADYGDFTMPSIAIDRCGALEFSLGCDVVDDGSTVTAAVAVVHETNDLSQPQGTWGANVEATLHRVCRLPRLPTTCIEGLLCAEPNDDTSLESIVAPVFANEVFDVVADSQCTFGDRGAAIDADLNAALSSGDPDRMTAAEAFEECMLDVERLRTVAPPTSVPANGAGLNDVFASSACLDAGRFAASLSWAADAAGRGEQDWGAYSRSVGRDALLGRMLHRWLQIHRQFSGEAVQRGVMDLAIAAEPLTGDPTPLDPADTLETAGRAWELLWLPRVAVAMDRARTESWADPDYRDHLTNTPIFGGEQSVALPVAMLESLQTEIELAAQIVERGQLTFDQSALDAPRSVFPTLFLAQTIAADLEARTRAEFGDASWTPRYRTADQRLTRATNRLFNAAFSLLRGDNPLGVEDADLPLYFFGDETGPGGQFSAISDYLIGTGPGGFAYAPFLVQRAQQSLDDARDAFNEQLDRDYQAAQSEFEHATRINDIQDDYEDQLEELCGSTSGSYVEQDDFTGGSCYMDPSCVAETLEDDETYYARIGAPAIGFQLCIGAALEAAAGPVAGFADPAVRAMASDVRSGSGCRSSLAVNTSCSSTQPCLECDGHSIPLSAGAFRVGSTDPDLLEAAHASCVDLWTSVPSSSLPDGPAASFGRSLPVRLDNGGLVECMAGSLGQHAIAVLAAQNDIEIAKSEAAEFTEAYDIAVNSCEIELATADAIEAANAAHLQAMEGLRAAKAVADIAAAAANGVKDCAATIAGSDKTTPWGAVAGGVATGASCAAGAVEVVSQGFSIGFGTALENAEQAHDDAVTELENEGNYEVCMNDAKLHLVGLETASLNVESAMLDLSSALAAMRTEVALANDQWAEGRDSIELESTRFARRPDLDLWLDESVAEYERRFRLARRTVYLAVRAVEYEFQSSLAARADVLAATTPSALEDVLVELWASSGTGGIGGNQPTDLKVVISLKDQLLQLADQSSAPDNEHGLTDEERFSLLLQSEKYAVYDEFGNYDGQRIPFSVVPFGTIGIGSTGGIGVLAGTDCAERLWSVNASIRGDDDLFIGSETSFARIDLLKRNTFFSQWCSPPSPDDPFQVASVRPSRNLFAEPGFGSDVASSELGVGNEAQSFSRARIEAFFNVPVAELESDEYANGETSELAARGLYGDYALFIDAGIISRESSSGSRTDGLVLDAIDDILLRLDYVSVAQ